MIKEVRCEFSVLSNSPLIGMTLGQVVEKYGVEINHFHNLAVCPEIRRAYDSDRVIDERLSIKVIGSWENVAKVVNASI